MRNLPENSVFYAIGDVHGMVDALTRLHLQIVRHHREYHEGRHAVVIHLGDYVDRGPDSKGVIELIMAMERQAAKSDEMTVVCLLGNHEEMLLQAVSGDSAALDNWLRNGGHQTLASYRRLGEDVDEALFHFPRAHRDWLSDLPDVLLLEREKLVFVHAGIEPADFPFIDHQVALWTRSKRFFQTKNWKKNEALDGFRIIHGHTPTEGFEPEVAGQGRRINVDTGAVYGGRLTAVKIDGAEPPEFLQAALP